MHAFSILTIAAVMQLAAAHSYMSSPPCFNCPGNHSATPRNVKVLSDPMKDKTICRGVATPPAAKAHRINGGNLEIEINAVKGHPGTCKFMAYDADLKNPVQLSTHPNCLSKTGRQTFSVPLKGLTGVKVIRYQWDEGSEHYDSCSLVRIDAGSSKGKSKSKSKPKAKSKGKGKAKTRSVEGDADAEAVVADEESEEVAEPKLVPASKRATKAPARKTVAKPEEEEEAEDDAPVVNKAAVKAPAPEKKAIIKADEEEDDGPSMEELDALFNGQNPPAPQESGSHQDDDDDCTLGEMECYEDGFRKCASGNEWAYFSCGTGTYCTGIPDTNSVSCQ